MPNTKLFAGALLALHQANLLREQACKPAIKTLIRQATEDKHWHLSAHYRSKKAEALIRKNRRTIGSPAQYQAFCRKHLRHEHMIPCGVVYQLILAAKPTARNYEQILRKTGYRATITRKEDTTLKRDTVPADFHDPNSRQHLDHLIRYKEANNLHQQLESRPKTGWQW